MSEAGARGAREESRFAGILLAAGASTRMGEAKQLLEWDGMPLVLYQRRQLEAVGCEPVVVVLGAGAAALQRVVLEGAATATRIVENARWSEGKTTSVRRGLEEVPEDIDGVLILSVDQPRPAKLLCELVARHREAGCAISVPAYQGRRGHPPLFSGALLPELRAIDEETQGLREVLRRHEDDVREIEMDEALVAADLNTPEQYRQARSTARRE